MKAHIFYLALCSLANAVYISRISPTKRMATVNRIQSPTVFRPGVSLQGLQSLQRPWTYGSMRLAPAASHRAPYYLYRKQPQRYAVKHFAPSATRNIFTHSPWKTTARLPSMSSVTPEYEFVKAASAQAVLQNDGGTGAIHTIPAPNLSLSEKPIVVIEASENPVSEQAKPSYEVTEKYPEGELSLAKIESPVGFSKASPYSTPELEALIRNGAALQLASELSLPAISINRPHPLKPQQFQMQSLSYLPSHQDLLNTGAEGIFIPQNALYQTDPMFMQKLQSQLIQRFPAVEFIPYAVDVQPNQVPFQTSFQEPQASEHHSQIVLLQNEQLDSPLHVPDQSERKNLVQRETQEASLIPQAFIAPNTTTEKQIKVNKTKQPQNITVDIVAAESQPVTTTLKYIIETNTEKQNVTPIYYAQVGQSVGDVITHGFYSAVNDVRAAATMAELDAVQKTISEKPIEHTTSTTTMTPVLKTYFVKNEDKSENKTTELKPILGAPFKKATDSVNVAYSLVRADDKKPKLTQEGAVYAGQIVEATISEDQDFNKEKASLVPRRAPIRLAVADSKNIASATRSATMPEVEVIKAKIPPKSKLTFDDNTGEPILRIYASYDDTTPQKDAVLTKLASLKPAKDSVIKRNLPDSWKGATVTSAAKTQGFDANQVTQFGLKLKQRSDDYIPLFEDYEN